MNSKEQVLEIIENKHSESGGSCGCDIPGIMLKVNLDYENIKPILNELFTQKVIRVRKGINGNLIFINDKNRTQKPN